MGSALFIIFLFMYYDSTVFSLLFDAFITFKWFANVFTIVYIALCSVLQQGVLR